MVMLWPCSVKALGSVINPILLRLWRSFEVYVLALEVGLVPAISESDAQVVVDMIGSKVIPGSEIEVILQDILVIYTSKKDCGWNNTKNTVAAELRLPTTSHTLHSRSSNGGGYG
ncbi:hypothetical protein Ddye_027174 [Dipteronia dyeriana]|uniref:Uncharacterized protein n=1 Tax=Dipteronia dyeriana TaxID=168575 RepID=A0AAD9TPH9_9ROSI|nr:hypothetical protein Ddye_027174 [Dipteronia dyeriana]